MDASPDLHAVAQGDGTAPSGTSLSPAAISQLQSALAHRGEGSLARGEARLHAEDSQGRNATTECTVEEEAREGVECEPDVEVRRPLAVPSRCA